MCDKKLDLTRMVQTKDGRPVKIIYTGVEGADYSVVALISNQGFQEVCCYTKEGTCLNQRPAYTLVNVPEKKFFTVQVRDADGFLEASFDTRADDAQEALKKIAEILK